MLKLLNLVFGSKMGTHRNEWEKLSFRAFYCKISQNKTPGDSKVTSSLGLALRTYWNDILMWLKNKHNLHRKYATF